MKYKNKKRMPFSEWLKWETVIYGDCAKGCATLGSTIGAVVATQVGFENINQQFETGAQVVGQLDLPSLVMGIGQALGAGLPVGFAVGAGATAVTYFVVRNALELSSRAGYKRLEREDHSR